MRRRAFLAVVLGAGIISVGLTGCVAAISVDAPPSVQGTPDSGVSATSAPAEAPLECSSLANPTDIARAFSGPGATAFDPDDVVAAHAPTSSLGDFVVESAGGLSCSWRVGPAALSDTADAESWGYVSVEILPDAGAAWTAQLMGDGPTDDRRTFAGISAAASCGDPGCWVSAPIDGSWVVVKFNVNVRETGHSVYGNWSDDQVFAAASPVIASIFTTISDASGAQLHGPHMPAATAIDCASILPAARMGAALRDPSFRWEAEQPAGGADQYATAARAAHFGTCEGAGSQPVSVKLAPGQAWIATTLAADSARAGAFHPIELPGLVGEDAAVTNCGGDESFSSCSLIFSLGTMSLEVLNASQADELAIAEAIVEYAR